MSGEIFAQSDKALDDRTIGHNPERLSLLKVGSLVQSMQSDQLQAGGEGGCLTRRLCAGRHRVQQRSDHSVADLRTRRSAMWPGLSGIILVK